MSARDVLEEVSDETGVNWSAESMLTILCDYIDNQQSEAALRDYVERRAEDENFEAEANE